MRLLDAIEQFGFGNWEDISKHIETRTPEGNVTLKWKKMLMDCSFALRTIVLMA